MASDRTHDAVVTSKDVNGVSRDAHSGDHDLETASNGLVKELLDSPSTRYRVHFAEESEKQQLLTDVGAWWQRRQAKVKKQYSSYTPLDWLGVFLPCTVWLRRYDLKRNFWRDLVAGCSVGAMVVPQGMSYANLAGLPAVYGLYGAFLPCLVYAALGSSRQLMVGPVAVTSLLLGSNLPDLLPPGVRVQANPNTPKNPADQLVYNKIAIQVAFVAGVLYTCVGLFRLGFLTNFLSHSVISGFTTGASLVIGFQQLKYFFGVKVPRHDNVAQQIYDYAHAIDKQGFFWREFIMGGAWLIILVTFKTLGKRGGKWIFFRASGPLTVTILSIAVVNIFNLEKRTGHPTGVSVVGKVPKGLPDFTVSDWLPIHNFGKLLGLAVVVCLIDVLESISIARAMAARHNYVLNPTQELRGLGVANLVGAAFNCYTTTGSFSRSALCSEIGGQTQLSGAFTGLTVMVTLLAITPAFTNMPQNAQGAIIISAITGLFNWTEGVFLWKVNKVDWAIFMVAALAVTFAGVEKGLAVAIGLSLALVLYKSAFPHTAVLGRLPNTTVYRNKKQYPEATPVDGVLMVRIDAPMYFANVTQIRDALEKYERKAIQAHQAKGTTLHYIIIDLSPVTDIDATAVHFFKDYIAGRRERGIQLLFTNPSRQVVRLMDNARLPHLLGGKQWIAVRMHDAVTYCQELLLEGKLPESLAKPDAQPEAVAHDSHGAHRRFPALPRWLARA